MFLATLIIDFAILTGGKSEFYWRKLEISEVSEFSILLLILNFVLDELVLFEEVRNF